MLAERATRILEKEFRSLDDLKTAQRSRPVRFTPGKDLCADVTPYEKHCAKTLDGSYINASVMPGSFGRAFIAAQGPLKGTVADFWSMIAHHRIQQIVALCGDEECAEYLPSEGQPLSLHEGALQITWKGDEAVSGVDSLWACKLEVRHGEDSWDITRLHCSAWADQGAIAPAALLQLAELVNKNGADSTTLVHCRAGVGRTGCLIALCGLVASAEHQARKLPGQTPWVSVPKAVVDLRRHRPQMVQTAEQYRLLYSAMGEWSSSRAPAEVPSECTLKIKLPMYKHARLNSMLKKEGAAQPSLDDLAALLSGNGNGVGPLCWVELAQVAAALRIYLFIEFFRICSHLQQQRL